MAGNTLGLTHVVSTKRAVQSENICFIFVKVPILLPNYLIKGRATDCCKNRLSEAINSMYSWYKASHVCYAYLADVHRGETLSHDLRKSQWFTRGWTLQELLAPRSVVFFDND
jgi:hypothetical protein